MDNLANAQPSFNDPATSISGFDGQSAPLPTESDRTSDTFTGSDGASSSVNRKAGTPYSDVLTTRTRAIGSLRALKGSRFVVDAFMVLTAITLVFSHFSLVRFISWVERTAPAHFFNKNGLLLIYGSLVLLWCNHYNLYRTRHFDSVVDECLAVIKALSAATLLTVVGFYTAGLGKALVLGISFTGVLGLAALAGWRIIEHELIERRFVKDQDTRRVLIIGSHDRITPSLTNNGEVKYVPHKSANWPDWNGVQHPTSLQDLSKVIDAEFVDEILVVLPCQHDLVQKALDEARKQHLMVKLVADSEGLTWGTPVDYLGNVPVFTIYDHAVPVLSLILKRLLDIVLSSMALVMILPLTLLITMAIKRDSDGPVIYRSIRIGKKARRFVLLKFRTMVTNADDLKSQLCHMNERRGLLFKIKDDPRLTRLGPFLRKYSLDELPQLWNVLVGDMSLVGPRPPTPDEFERYQVEHLRRLNVTPGITGLWQITAREDASFEKAVELDVSYIQSWNIWLDLKILFLTIPTVLKGTGY